MNTMTTRYWDRVPNTYTGIVFSPEKDKHWVVNGNRHREDGPASEFINGSKEWWLEGKCHREDGPAVECFDGTKHWFLEDIKYKKINLKNYVILDHNKRKYGIMWYRLLDEDKVIDYPDIPGLIIK
jgi:hypothetical protein